MGGLWQPALLLLVAMIVGTCFVFTHFLSIKHDAQEPPLAPSTIPYIGHAVGLIRSKFNYYVQLR
jgi:cytochrome c oxidase assembly factor CtaG